MYKEKKYSSSHFHRSYVVRRVSVLVFVFFLVSAAVLAGIMLQNQRGRTGNQMLSLWENGAYADAYEFSSQELNVRPLDYLALTINGFSAYQLGIAQINSSDTLLYIDRCIWSLRKALLGKPSSNIGELYYVLGKAYYHKGPAFADLAVYFLEKARAQSFRARDMSEFLGLSYASIRDYRSSVAAFAQALEPPETGNNPSDLLLISIARSYMELGKAPGETLAPAKPYLLRCIETSRDSTVITTSRLLYAGILMEEGNTGEAEIQYQLVLDETGGNAEAYYQLGEIYAARGDNTRARAEWRRAVRLDPVHKNARRRLNM
ncbi:MAG: tetratricopeptide repeat protein [Treponema sp.]|jgi:tetratricopeptide (TPR) repeat protein|nr:tetratricopeptide repeat protein [Treponema sp.]